MAPAHYYPQQLREPVSVARKTQTPDGRGGFATSEAVTGPHFAFVRPLRGEEREINDGLVGTAQVLFVLYAAVDVRSSDVLVYNGVRYNVRSILPASLSQFQEIEAESGVVN
jgi:hypothetical protein